MLRGQTVHGFAQHITVNNNNAYKTGFAYVSHAGQRYDTNYLRDEANMCT